MLRIHSNRSVDIITACTLPVQNNMNGVGVGNFYGTGNVVAASYGGNAPAYLVIWKNPSILTTADTTITVTDIPQAVEVGDLNNKGRDQIVVFHGGWSKVSVISIGYGVQTFSVPCPNNASSDGMVVADVNNDGKLDIVVCNTYAGMSVLINTTADITTDVSKVAAPDYFDINVYPNPFTNQLNVDVGENNSTIILFDIMGKVVFRGTGIGLIPINIDNLDNGIYFIQVMSGEKTYTKKIVCSK